MCKGIIGYSIMFLVASHLHVVLHYAHPHIPPIWCTYVVVALPINCVYEWSFLRNNMDTGLESEDDSQV